MRKLSWLIAGVALGFVTAHFVNQTPEGRKFFERVNRGAREFSDALVNGYHEAESEVEQMIDDVEQSLKDLDTPE